MTIDRSTSTTYPHGSSLSNLDISLENLRVHETQLKRCQCHDSRDGTEVEDTLVFEKREVVESVNGMAQSVDRHGAKDPDRLVLVLGPNKLLKRVKSTVLRVSIDLSGPEPSSIIGVFLDVSENVGLLQEETQGIGKDELIFEPSAFFAR